MKVKPANRRQFPALRARQWPMGEEDQRQAPILWTVGRRRRGA